jgi:signal transduction histidine kinase
MSSLPHPEDCSAPLSSVKPMRLMHLDVLVVVLALLGALVVALSFWLRAHYPSPGFIAEPGEHGWRVKQVVRDAEQGGLPATWQGVTLTRACPADGTVACVPLQPVWMSDSLTMPTVSAIRHFVQSQQALWQLASHPGQGVVFHAQGVPLGAPTTAHVSMRAAREFINERYALILLAAVGVYSVGCAMLAFVRRTREVWMVFAMCAGFFVYMLARSWYTSRTWAQPEAAWWLAIHTFRVGVLCCGTATVLTLWKVRLHGRNTWMPTAFCALIALMVGLHSLGLIESSAWGYRYPTLGYLLMVPSIAINVWRTRRLGSPGERLRSRTSDVVLLMGFAPLVVTMPLWTFRPDLPEISYLQNIALGLAAIPAIIIVARSTRYQLHEFWWRLWLVLAAAVVALVSASLMVLISGASAAMSLLLMLVLSSWVIYLLRGWLERRLIGAPPAIETFLPHLMGLQALQGDALESGWLSLLKQVFGPQSVRVLSDQPDHVDLVEQGDGLILPALGAVPALQLTGASQFTRSFGRRDKQLAGSLHALAQLGLQARASFVAGAVQERRRIAADLHDDIGGKLLHLARMGGPEGTYARNTLDDLRTITRGLSAQPRLLTELLADIHFQLRQRAERASVELIWHTTLPTTEQTTLVGSRQSTVLASVCSELMRNAMQHAGVGRVSLEVHVDTDHLRLVCVNDGAMTDPLQWVSGLGTTSIRRRVHDLQGHCAWSSEHEGGARFVAQWPLSNWLGAETVAPSGEVGL